MVLEDVKDRQYKPRPWAFWPRDALADQLCTFTKRWMQICIYFCSGFSFLGQGLLYGLEILNFLFWSPKGMCTTTLRIKCSFLKQSNTLGVVAHTCDTNALRPQLPEDCEFEVSTPDSCSVTIYKTRQTHQQQNKQQKTKSPTYWSW